MGCVQSYFKRAQNAGISPSSTQESNSKQPASEDGTKGGVEEKSIAEEPESNDTSYGVEATAVRTLAATTGTVAILGTTAKKGDKKGDEGSNAASPGTVEPIPEEQEESAVVHEEDKVDDVKEKETSSKPNSASRDVTEIHLEERTDKKEERPEERVEPPAPHNEVKEETPSSQSPANKSPLSESNKSVVTSPGIKSPIIPLEETEPKISDETFSDVAVNESTKEKEDDVSKSISSERLKTNSISNTTLSSDSIAELDNNSIKQSPSADKVIESFDSSSTVEFVDVASKEARGEEQLEGGRANTARSVSSDLSNKVSLPADSDKTPDALSPVDTFNEDDLPPPPPLEADVEMTTATEPLETPTELQNKEGSTPIISTTIDTLEAELNESENISPSKDPLVNDDSSINSEISSNVSSSVQSVVRIEESVQGATTKSAVESNSPNASEENHKAETGSPFSSDNNSSFNENGDTTSPVTAVILSPAPPAREPEVNENKEAASREVKSAASDRSETTPQLTNGLSSRTETPNVTPVEKPPSVVDSNSHQTTNGLVNSHNKTPEAEVNGKVSDDVFGSPIDLSDEKVIAAATAIQASFRGFQARQTLKTNGNAENDVENLLVQETDGIEAKSVEAVDETISNSIPETCEPAVTKQSPVNIVENEIKESLEENEAAVLNSFNEVLDSAAEQSESILENVDDKMIAAATTIQANFRGFQTRQTLKNKLDSGLPPSEETTQSSERKTPPVMTPELLESVKEEVNEICKEAESIAAERSESADGMLKGVEHVVVETKASAFPSVSESVQAVRGSVTPPSVSEDVEDGKSEVFDSLLDVDENTVNAATTIQATFRGFQARKNLQTNTQDQLDSMPDYPPPAAEDLLPSLDDLPPPDFEALESSYSEDVPTEPLAPPPPLDQDSLIFNEEDEDELMALQKPQECDELPEHRLTLETDSSDSSLSSAATKIQAGVRGYLTRKQVQVQGGGTGTTGTTSTSTNVLDSDQSLSVSMSRDEDGVRSAISTEEESEVCRHRASPEGDKPLRTARSAGKRMSLGSSTADLPPTRHRPPLRSAMSVQAPAIAGSDDEVWETLKGEMSEAATKIQSNFRGYRARKQLQREDAVQVTSSSGTGSGEAAGRGSAASGGAEDRPARHSGEFHDMIALTPPDVTVTGGESAAARPTPAAVADESAEMVKRRAEEEAKEAEAAVKIQATYRGFKSRQEMKEADKAAAKIQAGFRGYKVRKELRTSEPRRSSEPSKVPASEEAAAATKIQAGVRGFLVRRRHQRKALQ